ncbi:hypothetical protein GCM10011506_25680 [Marivirga lumbricoides]|uniref:Redoxin domain-containing protein n=1 Tax=Marivirga lumbricoides TaxID=1046115 RepID=A0ABQ1MEA4_9BACT|nr:hypothetical protein GCM10011506_25680 [Marivirga lumbricoides]
MKSTNQKIVLVLFLGIFSVLLYFKFTLNFEPNSNSSKSVKIDNLAISQNSNLEKSIMFHELKLEASRNWVILFSPNCSFCEDQINLLHGLTDRLAENDIMVYLISSLDHETTKTYLKSKGILGFVKVFYSSEEDFAKTITDFSYPYNLILDSNKSVLVSHKGYLGFNDVKKLFK